MRVGSGAEAGDVSKGFPSKIKQDFHMGPQMRLAFSRRLYRERERCIMYTS